MYSSGVAQAIAFWATIGGLIVGVFGFWKTLQQIKLVKSATEAAEDAISNLKFKVARYDASRDLSQASYAVETAKRCLDNESWRDASDAYEDARKALVRVQLASGLICDSHKEILKEICTHMVSFSYDVDAAIFGKGEYPDKIKIKHIIRQNYENILIIQNSISEGM
jgi:hypothetical protein